MALVVSLLRSRLRLRLSPTRAQHHGEPEKGRIAIKFGTSSASSSARPSPRPRPAPASSLGKRPRAHALGGASDSESDDDEHRHRGRHEAITGFGAHGAETERERRAKEAAKKEFVIARQPNRDWRAEMKAQRSSRRPLPGEESRRQQNGSQHAETEPADQDKEIKWGLTVKERKASEEADNDRQGDENEPETSPQQGDQAQKEPVPERTLDDEAMDALLGRTTKPQKTIIHPAPLTEDDAYRRDAETAGAASTLEDYEAMPVEEFGAALLRGMGWKGEERAPKPKEVRRRANRLGLGAKELKEDEDLGGWNQGGVQKKKRPRLDEYRREESRRKEGRRNHEDSYKREREREREGHRDDRDRHRDYGRHRDRDYHHHRHRDHDRERRR